MSNRVPLFLLCGLIGSAQAAEDASGPAPAISASAEGGSQLLPAISAPAEEIGQLFDFDIPAQLLATALQRYALISGRPALFSSSMVAGRSSNAVLGHYTPEAALRLLLEGTGLIAQRGKGGPAEAFVLKALSAQAGAARPAVSALNLDYGGWVQARVWDALCADARTAPGDYRALLRFEVDASGHIQQARLLTSTGSERRDAAVLDTLQRVHIDRSPPPDMAQPLTMILLPQDQGRSDRGVQPCGNSGRASRS